MSTPATSNRRNFYRQPMYQRVNLRVGGVRVPVPATLIDVSGGGCLLHARTMLKPQTPVEFDLPRPGTTALRLSGKLRKVTYTANDRTFRYAVEWEAQDAETHDQLLRFILDEQRRTISGARRAADEGALNPKTPPSTRIQELRAHRRVEVNIPIRFTVKDAPGNYTATAVDVSTGGLRIITDQVLRQEWVVTLWFTLPVEPLRVLHQLKGSKGSAMAPFSELKVEARPLGGVKQSRGRYVQSLVWLNPDPHSTKEINRFVQAVQLTSHGRR